MLNIVLVEPEIPQNCGNIAPVSYTHLDVYKRQAYNYANASGGVSFGFCV